MKDSQEPDDHQVQDRQKGDVEDYAAEFRTTADPIPSKLRAIARFGVNRTGVVQEVPIPDELQGHRYIQPMLDYINSPDTQFSPAMAGKYCETFAEMVHVASRNPHIVWRHFGLAFLKSLKGSGKSEFAIKDLVDRAKRIFALAENFSDDQALKRDLREITGVALKREKLVSCGKSSWPKLSMVPSKPKKSLECAFEDVLPYTNKQYLKAVSEYASAFVLGWTDIRRELRQNHPDLFERVAMTVQSFGESDLKKLETRRLYPYTEQAIVGEWQNLFRLGMEVLEALDNQMLNWSVIAQHATSIHFSRLLDAVNLSDRGAAGYSGVFTTPEGGVKGSYSFYLDDGTKTTLSAKLPFSLLDLLGPTLEEEVCIIWLLSCHRIQLSNIQRLKRRNVDIDKNSIWVRALKGRNGRAENVPILRNGGRALRAYIDECERSPSGMTGGDAVIARAKNHFRFWGTPNFSHLAIQDNVEGLQSFGASEYSLRVMKDIYSVVAGNNRIIGNRYKVHDGERPSHKSLSSTHVTQSAVYAEEARRGSSAKSQDMRVTHDKEDAETRELVARNQGHSAQVRDVIYRGRSRDKLLVEKRARFGALVSQEMVNIATEINEAREKKTSVLSVSELVAVVGLRGFPPETPPETLLMAAKAEKFIIEKSGLIRKNGETFLFDNGLTARMMMEEINHLERELEKLLLTHDTDKAVNVWAKYIFLSILLGKLSDASIAEASRKYGHLEGRIPHAPVSEGGNSWIVK